MRSWLGLPRPLLRLRLAPLLVDQWARHHYSAISRLPRRCCGVGVSARTPPRSPVSLRCVTHLQTTLHTIEERSSSLRDMSSASGNKLLWSVSAADIAAMADAAVRRSKEVYDAVGALTLDEVTMEKTIQVLADFGCEDGVNRAVVEFLQHVAPDKELREASVSAEKKLADWDVELSMRQDVFKNLVHAQKVCQDLEPEMKRFLERLILSGKRNGLHLSSEIQEEIKANKKKQSELCIDFTRYLNEENTVLEFTAEELVGLPENMIKDFEKTAEGKLKVTLKYPHYYPCMKLCRDPKTRAILEKAFHSRCLAENTPILEQLIALRQKRAALLGYKDHASFMLEIRMAKTPATVASFLDDMSRRLQPLWASEKKLFLEYKKRESEQYGYDDDGTINPWDYRYYINMAEEQKYAVDHERLREYFPMDVVTRELLLIYQELLSLEFEQVLNAETWHEDVTLYSVKDKASGELLGYFYLDLFPREGKYGHAACFSLQPGGLTSTGERQVHVVAMVANFTKPTADKPSLLLHDEVETYFHEFGHVMHNICSRTKTAYFSGIKVEHDFVEAPSQTLENWCWEKESLSRMSSHYKSGEKLPSDIIGKLIDSRKANAGIFNLRQILLSSFDQNVHTIDSEEKAAMVDTAKIFSDLCDQILGFPAQSGTNWAASFGHIAGGYDAQYYGYMWSEVFSMDMFYSRFKKEGILNPITGMDYRKCILEPGGSIDADVLLRNFLGRNPTPDAFLISKGLVGEERIE